MDGSCGIALAGAIAAFGVGAVLHRAAVQWMHRQHAGSLAADSANPSAFATVMRRGIGILAPLSRRLRRLRAVERFSDECAEALSSRGVATGGEPFLTVFFVCAAVVGCVGSALSKTLLGGVAMVLLGAVSLGIWARASRETALEQEREGVPDALSAMDACLKAGLSLSQTFDFVAAETRGALGARFSRASRVVKTGGTVAEALARLREGTPLPELAFAAVALDVQHVAGGSVAHVLESTRQTVKSEMELRRSLRVQTAQARLSAQVVSVMPFALVALFSLVSEDFLVPFFESVAGMALLTTAIAMQAVGIAAVRRMLRVGE